MKIDLSDAAEDLLRDRIPCKYAGTYVGGDDYDALQELRTAGLLREPVKPSEGGRLTYISRLNEKGREYAQRFGPGRMV